MKRFMIGIVALLLACSLKPGVSWLQGLFKQALEEAQTQGKPILLYFTSPT